MCSDPLLAEGRVIHAADMILADLLHGPEAPEQPIPRTALERSTGPASNAVTMIDDVLAKWLTSYVSPPTWPFVQPGESFTAMAVRRSLHDVSLGRALDPRARTWIGSLGQDPAGIIHAAFDALQIDDADRVAEMRGHLASIAGWSGLAKWRTEWAQPDDTRPMVTPTEIVALRALLEAAVAMSASADSSSRHPTVVGDSEPVDNARHLEERVTRVLEQLGLPDVPVLRLEITGVLGAILGCRPRIDMVDSQRGEPRSTDARDAGPGGRRRSDNSPGCPTRVLHRRPFRGTAAPPRS